LETVTPLFIAGADQRNIENEGLRAPSLRGLMRWWFRAIAGGGVSTVEKLKIEENKLFGSPNEKSAISIIVKEKNTKKDIFKNIMREIIKSRGRDEGQRYLWFSMTYGGNDKREVYLPRSTFILTIRSSDKDRLNLALGSLWCVIYLGGIGTRSRRGGGNLKVITPDSVDNLDFVFKGSSINDAKGFMENNLQKIFKLYSNFYKRKGYIKGMCILKKGTSEISLVDKKFNDFRDALSYVGEKYKEYRRRSLEPYTLGLPLGRPLTHKKTGARLHELRHSSPLFFGVMDLNGGYAIRITKFLTSIRPEFKQDQRWVKRNLNDFDSNINEIQVSIPEMITK